MPYYEFQCNVCDRTFEVKCSWKDLDKVTCPHCESTSVKRRYTGVGVLRQSPACADGCGTYTPSCEPGAST